MAFKGDWHARERAGHHAAMAEISLDWLAGNEHQITEAVYQSNATAALAHATLAEVLLHAAELPPEEFANFSEGSA